LKNEKEINQKLKKHTNEVNKFQDKLFKIVEVEQVPPAIAVGGAIAFTVSIITKCKEENPEMGKMLTRIVKRVFSLSGMEL
jgi:hypothetical protein